MNKNLHNLFVISSPSGGGKTSLLKAFFDDDRAKEIVMSISHTTRAVSYTHLTLPTSYAV